MAHPGFEFKRRSFHTLKNTSCLRKAYLGQMLGVRKRPAPDGDGSPLAAGKVFHTLMEMFYTPPKYANSPMPGTDGNPILRNVEEVIAHYEANNVAPSAIFEAVSAFERYKQARGDDEDVRSRVLGRPEPDVDGDFADILGLASGPVPYSAQFDMVIRNSNDPKVPKGVTAVEHKLLANFYPNTVKSYMNSGQLIGQCTVWNSREDLVERYGPMTQVMLNLTFKKVMGDKPTVHRTILFFPPEWQLRYAQAVGMTTRRLERVLQEYASPAYPHDELPLLWTQNGLVDGACVQLAYNCEFLEVCQDNAIQPELYQITERGRDRAIADKIVNISPYVETYE